MKSIILVIVLATCRAGRPLIAPIINVRCKEGTSPPGDLDQMLSQEARDFISKREKTFRLPDLDTEVHGKIYVPGKPLPNLNLWVSLYLRDGANADFVVKELNTLAAVDVVELITEIPDLPSTNHRHSQRELQATTHDFQYGQIYLGPAPYGIDAEYAWSLGITGAGVKVYDIENGWNQDHEDLQLSVPVLAGGTPLNHPNDPYGNHGTAVLGALVSIGNNGLGMKGICFDADVGLSAVQTEEYDYNPGLAILLAVQDGNPGDVILIEQQTQACGTEEYGPSEWSQTVFDVTTVATAKGFIVVAAAGNGDLDLDDVDCNGYFDESKRDSGAIIVGAGMPPHYESPRGKHSYSSYGSRVDAQGWGRFVWTLGSGDLWTDRDDPTNINKYYDDNFNGTSSASSFVAGVATLLQSYSKRRYGMLLSSVQMRNIFRQTGTPQPGNTQNIGRLPDLRQGISMVDDIFSAHTTLSPSSSPSHVPTMSPTTAPSSPPSHVPTMSPTTAPSSSPSHVPTMSPTTAPSSSPSNAPSVSPSTAPSSSPSNAPSVSPSTAPSTSPSNVPSVSPSVVPRTPRPPTKSKETEFGAPQEATEPSQSVVTPSSNSTPPLWGIVVIMLLWFLVGLVSGWNLHYCSSRKIRSTEIRSESENLVIPNPKPEIR